MKDISQPCFWRLDGLGRSLAFRTFAIATHVHDESALSLLNLKLMGEEVGEILADRPQDPGIVIGRQVWLQL